MELRCQFSDGCVEDNYDSCDKCKKSFCHHHIDTHHCGQQDMTADNSSKIGMIICM